jgi:xanthine dehydrogenase accessory factor
MFVFRDEVLGTVGGGNSEHQLYDRGKFLLKEGKITVEKIHLEHSDETIEESSGMICSGSQTFALITLDSKHIPIINKVIESYSKAQPGVLILNEEGIAFEPNRTISQDTCYEEEVVSWIYKETIGRRDRLFIIGGGHVSLALSRIMQMLDFHITVFDDREELPTMNSNSYANEKKIVSYEEISSYIPEGNNVYVTIMTFGHISDELVLRKIISKKCKYIGMMASASKKQQVFSNLEAKGISKNLLERIHSPIGVKIKSNTPEEIAISIAAEIIKIKNS